jgi:transposase-like protein
MTQPTLTSDADGTLHCGVCGYAAMAVEGVAADGALIESQMRESLPLFVVCILLLPLLGAVRSALHGTRPSELARPFHPTRPQRSTQLTRPKRKQRTYADEQKAAAMATLAAEGGNARKAAKVLGVSPSTLRGWAKHPMLVAPEMVEEATEKLDTLLEQIATRIAHGLNKPEALAKLLTKPAQAAVVMGITTDKGTPPRCARARRPP